MNTPPLPSPLLLLCTTSISRLFALTYHCPFLKFWNTGSGNHWERFKINKNGCKWRLQNIYCTCFGRGGATECCSISTLTSLYETSPSMRRNKELDSSFHDSYFLHYCGSCKLENRFLWGPLGERVFMNVLLVNWKLFPSRHHCLHSCNLACLADWWRGKAPPPPKKNQTTT